MGSKITTFLLVLGEEHNMNNTVFTQFVKGLLGVDIGGCR
jgi:hypothetical protein